MFFQCMHPPGLSAALSMDMPSASLLYSCLNQTLGKCNRKLHKGNSIFLCIFAVCAYYFKNSKQQKGVPYPGLSLPPQWQP